MSKGRQTREAVLDAAVAAASTSGLAAVSIGELARKVGMSKSGVFAHFESKENLQIEVLRSAVSHFIAEVVGPALKKPRGEARVRALFENWFDWSGNASLPGGCIFIAAASELDDKPGPVRDYLVSTQKEWLATLSQAVRIAVDEGQFRSDVDAQQLAHDFYSILLAYHHFSRLLQMPAARVRAFRSFEQLIESARVKDSSSRGSNGRKPAARK
ncbi:MAG TPA: TetR/AcrR family transcriptional regulator [Thermoanaerobaculia bacterium]|nr:TetR/AcrR family transcriptional regulator [Thermoanaerobaculia bacterium]